MLLAWGVAMMADHAVLSHAAPAGGAWLAGFAMPVLLAMAIRASGFWTFLWRAKWLFIGIFALGLWATPGEALTDLPGATREGARFALVQSAVLVAALAWLTLLLHLLSRERLVAALCWCLTPLNSLGLDGNRVAVRIALTLRAAEQFREGGEADLAAPSVSISRTRVDIVDALILVASLVLSIGVVAYS